MENGLRVARFLETHPLVKEVLHPGLLSHPQHKLALSQCSGFSGMVSFYINGGINELRELSKRTKIFVLAESLGGVESLMKIPALMVPINLPDDTKKTAIEDNFIRLSVGIESTQDLINDLAQALDAVQKLNKQN